MSFFISKNFVIFANFLKQCVIFAISYSQNVIDAISQLKKLGHVDGKVLLLAAFFGNKNATF